MFARPMRCTARPSWISRRVTAPSKDPLIGMGTAPLDDPLFRSAIFEQLGGAKLGGGSSKVHRLSTRNTRFATRETTRATSTR